MTIQEYFEEYTAKYHEMKKALKRYLDAKSDFYYLSGTKYDDMPKGNSKSLGFDDIMSNIEELNITYIQLKKECIEERGKCQADIDKINNHIHRLILEYVFLDLDKDKKVITTLKEFHNMDYSYSHFRRLKSEAVKEFLKIIQNDIE